MYLLWEYKHWSNLLNNEQLEYEWNWLSIYTWVNCCEFINSINSNDLMFLCEVIGTCLDNGFLCKHCNDTLHKHDKNENIYSGFIDYSLDTIHL